MKTNNTFTVNSGKLTVSDPCYDPGTWCSGTIDNVLNGTWKAILRADAFGSWGERVSELVAYHDAHSEYRRKADELCNFEVGVDSGQAGIFDAEYYAAHGGSGEFGEPDTFYGRCCAITMDDDEPGGTLEHGCVSSSGFGDGGYQAFVARNDAGQVVAVRVVFIGEDEQFDDDEY